MEGQRPIKGGELEQSDDGEDDQESLEAVLQPTSIRFTDILQEGSASTEEEDDDDEVEDGQRNVYCVNPWIGHQLRMGQYLPAHSLTRPSGPASIGDLQTCELDSDDYQYQHLTISAASGEKTSAGRQAVDEIIDGLLSDVTACVVADFRGAEDSAGHVVADDPVIEGSQIDYDSGDHMITDCPPLESPGSSNHVTDHMINDNSAAEEPRRTIETESSSDRGERDEIARADIRTVSRSLSECWSHSLQLPPRSLSASWSHMLPLPLPSQSQSRRQSLGKNRIVLMAIT